MEILYKCFVLVVIHITFRIINNIRNKKKSNQSFQKVGHIKLIFNKYNIIFNNIQKDVVLKWFNKQLISKLYRSDVYNSI